MNDEYLLHPKRASNNHADKPQKERPVTCTRCGCINSPLGLSKSKKRVCLNGSRCRKRKYGRLGRGLR